MLFLGIDVGTQGARGIICDEQGQVFAQGTCNFWELNTSRREVGCGRNGYKKVCGCT